MAVVREQGVVFGLAEDFLLQPLEGALALAIEQRHVDVKKA